MQAQKPGLFSMLEKLKKKWNLNTVQVILVLCTFALGGSMDGYITRKLMALLPLDKNVLWYVIYIIILTILWPLCVLVISIFFGQFRFFWQYLKRVAKRMKLIK